MLLLMLRLAPGLQGKYCDFFLLEIIGPGFRANFFLCLCIRKKLGFIVWLR